MSDHAIYRGHIIVPASPKTSVLIPHAQTITKNGTEYAMVPHALEETKVLRNLGFNIPPPILQNYDWCGTTPFDAQRMTAALISMNASSFVLNDLGTGKTRAVLFAYDYMRRCGVTKSMLVVAPLSTLRVTWAKEVMTVFPHLKYQVLYGSRKKRVDTLAEPADIYIINHDGVEILLPHLLARPDIDMLCLDELTAYKEPRTDRWKATNQLARKMKVLVGMTGAPTPNAPTDAYGQVKVIRPGNMKFSFNQFRDHTMRKITTFKFLPKTDASERVFELMQPAVRFTRDDCYDLPPCQTITSPAPLTAEQEKVYREVARECAAQVRSGTIMAVNEADRLNKLTQVALGTVYTTDRQVQHLDCTPRLDALVDAVHQSNSKVIVFTPYKASIPMLRKHLEQWWAVEQVTGDTPAAERDRIFTMFTHSASPHIIVAHPQCMSHGLTLTAASTIVWYGPPPSLEIYEQANARITRPGQKYSQLIVNIAGTRVEERVYQRLNARAALQGLLLEMYEKQELEALL
jgi:SNF2 family DNA or RNA helicase